MVSKSFQSSSLTFLVYHKKGEINNSVDVIKEMNILLFYENDELMNSRMDLN